MSQVNISDPKLNLIEKLLSQLAQVRKENLDLKIEEAFLKSQVRLYQRLAKNEYKL